MVRTKADAARKAGGKAPRKTTIATRSSTGALKSGGKKGRQGGGNPYHPRPAPYWQIPINKMFPKSNAESAAGSAADLDPPLEGAELVNAPSSSIDLNVAGPSTSHESIESVSEDDVMNAESATGSNAESAAGSNAESAAGSAADLDPPLESAELVNAPSSSIDLNVAGPSTSHESIESGSEDVMNGETAAGSNADLDSHQENPDSVTLVYWSHEPSNGDSNAAGPSVSIKTLSLER